MEEPQEPAYAETVPQSLATATIFGGVILAAVVATSSDLIHPWYLAAVLGGVGGAVVAGVLIGVVAALWNRP